MTTPSGKTTRAKLERWTHSMNMSKMPPVRLVIFALLALALTGCRSHDFPQYPANYREYAYVTNGDSGT